MNASIRQLKDHLSEYVRRAQAGEEVIITSHNKPVVKLVAVEHQANPKEKLAKALEEMATLRKATRGKIKGESMSKLVIRMRREARY